MLWSPVYVTQAQTADGRVGVAGHLPILSYCVRWGCTRLAGQFGAASSAVPPPQATYNRHHQPIEKHSARRAISTAVQTGPFWVGLNYTAQEWQRPAAQPRLGGLDPGREVAAFRFGLGPPATHPIF